MPYIFRYQVAGKQVDVQAARPAGHGFDPEEIFDLGFRIAADFATCFV